MAPAWTQFESDYQKKLEIVYINVDQRDSAEFKKYAAYAPQSIPFTCGSTKRTINSARKWVRLASKS